MPSDEIIELAHQHADCPGLEHTDAYTLAVALLEAIEVLKAVELMRNA